MKKIILVLIAITCFAESQTTTSVFKLPQWQVGDTLKVRTKNDSAQSNIGLNYAFYRLEALLSNQLNGSGLTTYIKGYDGANLIIDADYNGATPRAVVVNDSLFVNFNGKFLKNVLVTQNLNVGGYITTDSITGGTIVMDSINARTLSTSGALIANSTISSFGTISSDVGITANGDILSSQSFTVGENVGGYLPTSGNQLIMYVKGDKFIIVYNDGGTYKYRSLDLTSTNANWTYGTTEP